MKTHPVVYDIDGNPREVLGFMAQPQADGLQSIGYRGHLVAHGKPDRDGWPTEYWIFEYRRKYGVCELGDGDDDLTTAHDDVWDAIKEANRRFRA